MLNQQYYNNEGTVNLVSVPTNDKLTEQMPVGNYEFVVEKSMMGTKTYFKRIPEFDLPKKFYGNTTKHFEHFAKAFQHTDKNLGVLLSGTSGTGKSLLSKYTCSKLQEQLGIPTIVITKDSIEFLPSCLQMLKHPCVIFIDEFEKMFEDTSDQNFLLSMMDGIYNTKHLFLLTANDSRAINPYMLNRPSRIRYHIEFNSLSSDFIEEVVSDLLEDTSKKTEVIAIVSLMPFISFDILKEFILEVNRFPETAVTSLAEMFNISVSFKALRYEYTPSLYLNGALITSVKPKVFNSADTKNNITLDTNIRLYEFSLANLIQFNKNPESSHKPYLSLGDLQLNILGTEGKRIKSDYNSFEIKAKKIDIIDITPETITISFTLESRNLKNPLGMLPYLENNLDELFRDEEAPHLKEIITPYLDYIGSIDKPSNVFTLVLKRNPVSSKFF